MRKRDVARYIMDAISTNTGSEGVVPADQLALVLLLEGEGPLTVGMIGQRLGRGPAATSALVDRAEARGRVTRSKDHIDHRHTLVTLDVRSLREQERSRGGRRPKPYVKGPARRQVNVDGAVETLECGHVFVATRKDRVRPSTRRCEACARIQDPNGF